MSAEAQNITILEPSRQVAEPPRAAPVTITPMDMLARALESGALG